MKMREALFGAKLRTYDKIVVGGMLFGGVKKLLIKGVATRLWDHVSENVRNSVRGKWKSLKRTE